jgi:hypothetical protein
VEEPRAEGKEEEGAAEEPEQKPAEPAVTVKKVRRRKLKAKPNS